MEPQTPVTPRGAGLEERIQRVGQRLGAALDGLVEAVPGTPRGPQRLAAALGVDKVLTSRLLKALRLRDPVALLHYVPGPEPLRRLVRAGGELGVRAGILHAAAGAIDDFERLVQQEVGDRSALGTILAAWLPEVRSEFELRRKQAAFRALSQLKGVSTRMNLSAVFLHPAENGSDVDVVWLIGQLGLERLRPGVGVKFATRRMLANGRSRRPRTLAGAPIESLEGSRLDAFCTAPPAPVVAHSVQDVVHYILGGEDYGPRSAVDLLFAEVNLAEMPRAPASGRRGYVFAEVPVPAKTLVLDCFVHTDVYPGCEPELLVYDASLEGVADVNDRTRDIDRMDLGESIQLLGEGLSRARLPEVSNYVELLRHVHACLGWDESAFRGYRCRIEYPIHGSQVVLAFESPGGSSA